MNNWFIKVTFTRNPEPIEQRSWGSGLRVNDLYKPIIHFKCLLGVYLFMNKHWLGRARSSTSVYQDSYSVSSWDNDVLMLHVKDVMMMWCNHAFGINHIITP